MITETHRLVIAELIFDDADFILQLLNEPLFHKYIGDKGIRTKKEAEGYLTEGPLASYERYGYGLYVAKLKKDDSPIGICGFKKRKSLDIPDLGYAFLKKYRGKGYATEAGQAVIAYARNQLALTQLAALTAPDNQASVRVLEKLGFRYQKTVRLPEFESENKLFTVTL